MAQRLYQTQEQKQQQVQRLSQQQMLQVKLLEMPLTELEESVTAELDDNPALETANDDPDYQPEETDKDEELPDFEEQSEQEERKDALDSALERIGDDDDLPVYTSQSNNNDADYEEMVYGDTTSFIDKLNEQMGEYELTDRQRSIMEYLIGSLDDPAGIGARSLQECLLLQIARRPDSRLKTLMQEVVEHHFEAFTKKHWDKISQALKLNSVQTETLQQEIRKLNPKPGASLSETQGRNINQITPDFIVDTGEDGSVTFTLNRGHIPELHVSPSFAEMLNAYKDNKKGMSRQAKEALLYAKEKVDKAQGFIDAVKQRQHTLCVTMQAIIDIQRKFFQDGDESDLKPMILQDVADRTGLDKSTISRVSNIKYAQTKWGIFPLRFFFTDSYTTEGGEELSTRKMKIALKEIVEKEDKNKPMSDDALTQAMKAQGYPIARRTVAKYREQLGIPVARLRKE